MTEISAALVKELRDRTGAGMMDCKRALQDTNGDIEAAQKLLRERGMASAAKRADRATTEGKVGFRLNDDRTRGVIVAVGCETEPVSNNDEFLAFAEKVLETVERDGPGAESQLDEERQELSGKLGENIVVTGAARFEAGSTPNGKVGYRVSDDGKRGVIVAVGCETEPVSDNDEFLAFAKKVLEAVERDGPGAEAELDEERQELAGKLGENIVVAGAARFEAVDGALIDGYAHPPANKLGVLVQLRGGPDDLARKVAMHIAASAPQWIGRDDVPDDVVAAEREIYSNSDEVQSKPEQAREKIVEGMLNKRFFAAQVLTEQPWIHDTAKTVGEALRAESAEVLEFERLQLA